MVDLRGKHPEFINGYVSAQKEVLELATQLVLCTNMEDMIMIFNEFIKCQQEDMLDYIEWWNENNDKKV